MKQKWNITLPVGTSVLPHQVAGHYHEANKSLLGIVKHSDGSVLKPSYEDERGKREHEFYCKIFGKGANETDINLKPFLPKFLGIFKTSYRNKEVSFIKLEDLTKTFFRPCILDVKIAPRGNHKKIGFRIVGTGVYFEDKDNYEYKNKQYYESMDSFETVSKALKTFFMSCQDMSKVVRLFLLKLEEIENWFLYQRSYVFNSSSLLLIYEGGKTLEDSNTDDNSSLELKMIDFAHVYPTSQKDSNYILGLQNFISCLRMLLRE